MNKAKAALGKYWRDLSGNSVKRFEDATQNLRVKHHVEARDLSMNGGSPLEFEELARKQGITWDTHKNNYAQAVKRRFYTRALTGAGVAGISYGASLLSPSKDNNKSE